MTPEERLNKLEGDLARMRVDHDISIAGLRRLAIQFMRMSRAEYEANMADHRAFMAEIKAERAARKAEHQARMAEIQADRGRLDGIEEMTKLLRELLEKNLHPPDKPPEAKN